MSIVKTVKETNNYSYDIDTAYGTGWFVRKRDDMVSLMDTGLERDALVVSIKQMNNDEFDALANKHTYTGRWTEDS